MTADTTTEDPTAATADEGLTQTVGEALADAQQDTTTPEVSEKDDDGKGGKSAILADLAKERDARQATQAKLDAVLKAAGLDTTDEDDPVEVAKTSKADAQQARTELAVYKAAGPAGADPDALLDSASFLKALGAIDPTDTAAVTAAIKAAVEGNDRYAAGRPATTAHRDAVTKGDTTTPGPGPDDWLRNAAHRS